MEGINTAIVGYILLCLVMPQLVKNKTQYYMALWAVLLDLVLNSVGAMVGGTLANATQCIGLLLTACALILLVLSSGGLSFRELAGEMGSAMSDTFSGQQPERTPIVPLTGAQPRRRDDDDEPRERFTINDPAPRPEKSDDSIPLD